MPYSRLKLSVSMNVTGFRLRALQTTPIFSKSDKYFLVIC